MPVTDGERVNIFDRRVLGAVDFRDRILDFLEDGIRRHTKAITTGVDPNADPGSWFQPVTVEDGSGANDLTFGGMFGSDGTGNIISVDPADARIVDVPFQDTAATTYYLATRTAEVPEGIQASTDGSGILDYDRSRLDIGHRAEPTVVVDGGSTLTLTLGNHKLDASDDFTGRTAIVFLKVPEGTTPATAIETVTVVGVTATTVGLLGQSTPSTTVSDYEVVLLGPTITRSTSVETAARWAFIGTVVGGGAPRTFDTSTQPQIVPLDELSSQQGTILGKGWVGLPTVGTTATTITISTTAVVFTAGRLLTTPSGASFGSLAATSDVFIYYSVISGDFVMTTSWDTANQGTNVPIFWAFTDGASNIVSSARIGWLVQRFPDTLKLTASDDATHRGAFRNLASALAHARAIQKGSTLAPRGIEIEIIGDLTASATIDEVEYYDLKYVTFQGRGTLGGILGGGARLKWSHTAKGLFEVPSGATMTGWAFRDLTFQCNGVAAAAKCAVVSCVGTSVLSGVSFERCIVDGTGLLSGSGGGTGRLPYLIYGENSGFMTDIQVRSCQVLTVDGVIRATSASRVSNLRMNDVKHSQAGVTHVAASGSRGFVLDDGSLSQQWWITDCEATDLDGSAIRAVNPDEFWVHDNWFETQIDAPVIELGDGTTTLENIFVHDNLTQQNIAAGVSTTALVYLRGIGSWTGIIIHSNIIDGDGTAGASGFGIFFDSAAGDLAGAIVHSNAIVDVDTAISLNDDCHNFVMVGNYIEAGSVGIEVVDSSGDVVIAANAIDSATSGGFGVRVASGTESSVITGNYVESGTNGTGLIAQGPVVVTGNRLEGTGTGTPLDIGVEAAVIVGNDLQGTVPIYGTGLTSGVAVGNFATGWTLDGAGLVMAGNNLTGTLDINEANNVIAGNNLSTTDFNSATSSTVMTGNRVTSFNLRGQTNVVTGNRFAAFADTPAAAGDLVITGNYIGEAVTFEHDDGPITGNFLSAASTAGTSSSDLAVVGNRIVGGFTDSGTSNTEGTATTNDLT